MTQSQTFFDLLVHFLLKRHKINVPAQNRI
jgi:hypothetical protein